MHGTQYSEQQNITQQVKFLCPVPALSTLPFQFFITFLHGHLSYLLNKLPTMSNLHCPGISPNCKDWDRNPCGLPTVNMAILVHKQEILQGISEVDVFCHKWYQLFHEHIYWYCIMMDSFLLYSVLYVL